jgi:hypothetical protein
MRKYGAGFALAALLFSMLLSSCGLPTQASQATPPSIRITSPASGQQVAEGGEIAILFAATDAQGVSRVEIGVDGVLLQTVLNPAPAASDSFAGEQTWTASAPGSHSVMAVAYNTAGVASAPAVTSITVVAEGDGASVPQSGEASGGGSGPTATWTPLTIVSEAATPPPASTSKPPPPTDTMAPPPASATPRPAATAKPTAKPAGGARPSAAGPITGFETFGTWKRGDQPNGTFVQSTEQAHGGSYSGKLTYDFPSGGNDFVVFSQSFKLGGRPNQVSAWVYGDGSKHFLNVWLRDAAGETWQFPLGQIKHSGWQQMLALLDPASPWPAGHIDGPSNSSIDYPADLRALVLDDVPDGYVGSGAIYIDDLSCAEGPAPLPPATSRPSAPAASIDFWADDTTVASGNCTWLHWEVYNVRAVYLDGAGVVGEGKQKVCPAATTTYVLHVVHRDGTASDHPLTISVTSP